MQPTGLTCITYKAPWQPVVQNCCRICLNSFRTNCYFMNAASSRQTKLNAWGSSHKRLTAVVSKGGVGISLFNTLFCTVYTAQLFP